MASYSPILTLTAAGTALENKTAEDARISVVSVTANAQGVGNLTTLAVAPDDYTDSVSGYVQVKVVVTFSATAVRPTGNIDFSIKAMDGATEVVIATGQGVALKRNDYRRKEVTAMTYLLRFKSTKGVLYRFTGTAKKAMGYSLVASIGRQNARRVQNYFSGDVLWGHYLVGKTLKNSQFASLSRTNEDISLIAWTPSESTAYRTYLDSVNKKGVIYDMFGTIRNMRTRDGNTGNWSSQPLVTTIKGTRLLDFEVGAVVNNGVNNLTSTGSGFPKKLFCLKGILDLVEIGGHQQEEAFVLTTEDIYSNEPGNNVKLTTVARLTLPGDSSEYIIEEGSVEDIHTVDIIASAGFSDDGAGKYYTLFGPRHKGMGETPGNKTSIFRIRYKRNHPTLGLIEYDYLFCPPCVTHDF